MSLEGTIVSSSRDFRSGDISPASVEKALSVIAADPLAAAVVLQMNSPGGSAAGSEDVYKIVERFKAREKLPIVVYVSDIAASGGYYIAQAADYVIVNPNALVGSIGVISIFISVDDLLKKKLDINPVIVKSGKFKDSGSPLRSMTKEEIDYWHSMTMQYYGHFVDVVAKGRKLTSENVRSLADGRVYHPNFAMQNKLIDQIGSFEDSLSKAKELAKISSAKVVRADTHSRMGGLFGLTAPAQPFEAAQKLLLHEGMRNRILYYADGY